MEFVFRHEDELPFRPGQFISVQVGMDEQNNPILRSYSLASSPERRGELVLILRLLHEGPGSRFFAALRQGDTLRFTGPMGFFVNELSHPGDAIYAATGTGIAPLGPMVEETLRRNEPGKVLLFWGLRGEDDIFWEDRLGELSRGGRLVYRRYLSQAGPAYAGPRGRICAPILEQLSSWVKPTFYLCGNGSMIEELKGALVARGIDRKKQIRTEAFFD